MADSIRGKNRKGMDDGRVRELRQASHRLRAKRKDKRETPFAIFIAKPRPQDENRPSIWS